MRIFNQLRKLQIEKQKIKNYLIYATGEILLIVVGILIALQINNWNVAVNTAQQRTEALEILQQSSQANETEIDRTLRDFDRLRDITNARILHSGPGVTTISDSLIRIIREIDLVKLNLVQDTRNTDLLPQQNLSLLSSELRNLLLR